MAQYSRQNTRIFIQTVHGVRLTGIGALERGILGGDHVHQLVPGADKRLRPFVLKPGRQGVDIDTCLRELRQDFLAVTAVCRQEFTNFAVLRQRFQCALRHGVDREGRREGLDVEDVGCPGIFPYWRRGAVEDAHRN